MKLISSTHRSAGRFLSGSVALMALVLASCNSTGTASNGQSVQLSANNNGSLLADTLQSAADQAVAAEAGQTAKAEDNLTDGTASEAKNGNAQQAPVEANTASNSVASADETQPGAEATQVAAASPPEKKSTSLLGFLGGSGPAKTTQAEPSQTSATPIKTEAGTTQTAQNEAVTQTEQPEKPAQATSLFGTPKTASAFATPQRPTASQGSIARLFSEDSGNGRSDRAENKKLAVVKAVSPAAKHNYSYALPGVRANAGFEIKHRNSLADDSDVDANEYDEFPGVTLASAPGLARLAPNGLKVQRETVDVACLKPQLVTMLRTIERHFRRPVVVTSGYRSPNYNRKVNGARKSLHMICAAADIQVEGVSKWELARYARSMRGRGGVGTYCHTKSVHVDVGPDRDWNWRCKR
ncbi:D-Ala-D-Ala carboxypeptidase family metallohydrolase [Brucella sp. BE17]|uniref:D-Ala-D-Ala carboxypeptidase family metallohydrolase n=1 Tax=Brucella sp. BE17 TaxID=3142977 RepID=UPI0031BBBF59